MNKKLIAVLFLILTLTGGAAGQHFTSFLQYVNKLPEAQRQAKVDSFMLASPVSPYHDNDTTVVFVYQGSAAKVFIAGDFTGWQPEQPMKAIPGTNLFYCIKNFEQDARLEYKYVTDGKWDLDPKNPAKVIEGPGPNSEFRMPYYVSPPWLGFDPTIPHGTIKDTLFKSAALGNSRTIKIYLPANYGSVKIEYPVVLFHDGIDFLTMGFAANVLDYLIAHQQMAPVIAVFVPGVNREDEYAGNLKSEYTTFIANELMPVIDKKYTTSRDPHHRATIGISNGGNIAIFLGMVHPAQFGKVASMSGNVETSIKSIFTTNPKMDLEFYLDMGKYDLRDLPPLLDDFVRILSSRNYAFQRYSWHEGHSWINWAGHLSFPLKQFFPYHN
jgi:enterochelin esterase family protein